MLWFGSVFSCFSTFYPFADKNSIVSSYFIGVMGVKNLRELVGVTLPYFLLIGPIVAEIWRFLDV